MAGAGRCAVLLLALLLLLRPELPLVGVAAPGVRRRAAGAVAAPLLVEASGAKLAKLATYVASFLKLFFAFFGGLVLGCIETKCEPTARGSDNHSAGTASVQRQCDHPSRYGERGECTK